MSGIMPRRGLKTSLIIVAALCVSSLPFVLVGELPGERWLSAQDEHAARFALTGAALLAVDVLLPIPSSIVGTMLGARLGLGLGFVAAFAGMMVGQCAAYLVSRALLGQRQAELPSAPTLAAVFLSRPVPVLAEAVVLSAGAARLRWPQFLLACASGNAIYAGALALNGAQLVPDAAVGPGLLLPMLLPAGSWLLWRRLRRNEDRGD
jgi:uncharacterized membrane protein YdjX (TVP38/TMEM64 family)